MAGLRPLVAVACLLCAAAPVAAWASAASDPPQGLVRQAQELRGLRLLRPLAISRLSRARMGALVVRLQRRDPDPLATPAWDDALHLLGVLRAGQRLAVVLRRELQAQVAGLYDPRSGRLYLVRSAGGGVPSSVVVHEATHALQDQHFDLSRPAFGARPGDADGSLAARAVVEGDATDVQQRYLRRAGLVEALLESAGAVGDLAAAGPVPAPPFLLRELEFPYLAGSRFVAALRARGGERLVDRALRRPPRTTAAVLDPSRYLRGDPPAAAVALPPPPSAARRAIATTFGAGDLEALTGSAALATAWRGGRLSLDAWPDGRRLLRLRLRTVAAVAMAATLERVLPADVVVSRSGRFVSVVAAGRSATRGLSG
jgi:hypothetical protein